MSDAQMKAPGRLRRPSYFHAVAGGGGGGVSGRVLEALVAHQQQGKLAHSALGEVPVMIPAPPYICLQLQWTVETLRLTVQAINLVYLLLDLASSQAARASVGA